MVNEVSPTNGAVPPQSATIPTSNQAPSERNLVEDLNTTEQVSEAERPIQDFNETRREEELTLERLQEDAAVEIRLSEEGEIALEEGVVVEIDAAAAPLISEEASDVSDEVEISVEAQDITAADINVFELDTAPEPERVERPTEAESGSLETVQVTSTGESVQVDIEA